METYEIEDDFEDDPEDTQNDGRENQEVEEAQVMSSGVDNLPGNGGVGQDALDVGEADLPDDEDEDFETNKRPLKVPAKNNHQNAAKVPQNAYIIAQENNNGFEL